MPGRPAKEPCHSAHFPSHGRASSRSTGSACADVGPTPFTALTVPDLRSLRAHEPAATGAANLDATDTSGMLLLAVHRYAHRVRGGRTPYSQALAAFDQASIVASLSDDVTIRVAVHDEPLRGKDTAGFLFRVLTQQLTPFHLTEELVEGNKNVVLFETSLRWERAHGLTSSPTSPMVWSGI